MIDASKKEFWLVVEKLLQGLLNKFVVLLDSESVDSIQHYLDHSEYEMAFEGLFIELMKANADMDRGEMETYFKLGQDLGLDEDSVFDGNFWEQFRVFVGHE